MVVAQDLLQSAHVYAVLKHQSSGSVAQLMGGILGAVQPGSGQMLFHQLVHRSAGDAPAVLMGDEEGLLIDQCQHVPLCQPILESLLTGFVEKEDPFLVALAQDSELIAPDIGHVLFRPTSSEIRRPQFKNRVRMQ